MPVLRDPVLRKQFARFPFTMYKGDPAWVPPLLMGVDEELDPEKGPFFSHGEAELFIAMRDGQSVGTISAQIERQQDRIHKDGAGFFGYFECIDDQEVAKALFESAEAWLRGRRARVARGPYHFYINGQMGPGLQIDGFDTQPMMMIGHHRPHYQKLVEACGYGKIMEMLAWRLKRSEVPAPDKLAAAVAQQKANSRIKIRSADKTKLGDELRAAAKLYNEWWVGNWGHVPIPDSEIEGFVKATLPVLDPRVFFFIDVDNEPAAMMLNFPDLNEIIKMIGGKMFPTGIITFMRETKKQRRGCRSIVGGVNPKYRGQGGAMNLALYLAVENIQRAIEAGYQEVEFSWELQHNEINSFIGALGAKVAMRYAVYEKPL